MIIDTFVEGETQQTARVVHEAALRGVSDPWEVDQVPIHGKPYRVVGFVENPSHPAYLFLVRPDQA